MSPEQITNALETGQHWGMTGVALLKNICKSLRRDGKSHDEVIATLATSPKLTPEQAESWRAFLMTYDKRNAEEQQKAVTTAAAKVEPLELTSLWPKDFAGDVPKRPWQIPGLTLRGQLTLAYGRGGTAKSLWTVTLAVATALGIEILGYKPDKPAKVLMINVEDDVDEMLRRNWACRCMLNCSDKEMQYLTDRILTIVRTNYSLVERNEQGVIGKTPFYAELLKICLDNDIGLMVLDPLVSLSRGLDENSAEMQELLDAVRELARDLKIPIIAVHHTSKSGVGGDQNAGRGSSVMSALARTVVTHETMGDKDGELFKVPAKDRWQYICVKVAKSNHGSRSGERWFKTVPVTMPSGELVAALEAVTFEHKSVLDEKWLPAFLTKVEAGRGGNRYPTSGPDKYRANQILIDEHGLAPHAAKTAIEELIAEGVLKVRKYTKTGANRGEVEGLFVLNWPEKGGSNDLPM
jgi:RecA-family ATPase